jgi:hypothetical protein
MTDDPKEILIERYPDELEYVLRAMVCSKEQAYALQKANFTASTIFYWSGEHIVIIKPNIPQRDETIAKINAMPTYNVEQLLRFYPPLMQISIVNFQDRLMVFAEDDRFKCSFDGNLADSLANDLLERNAKALERIEAQKKTATLQ